MPHALRNGVLGPLPTGCSVRSGTQTWEGMLALASRRQGRPGQWALLLPSPSYIANSLLGSPKLSQGLSCFALEN